jgi:Sulfotransferase domain
MISVSKNILNRLKRIFIESKYQRNLPVDYRMEDIFLVSFPKSGNTWLRFLIANAIKTHYNIHREVNFFTIQDIIPDVDFSRNISSVGVFGKADLPRIIKSHSSYNPYYNRVILLVRDPRDVIVSYYYFIQEYFIKEQSQIHQNWTLSNFIRDKRYGVKAWLEHTKSWYSTGKVGQIIKIFKYEDFLEFPEPTLYALMELLGISMSRTALEKTIELSSFESMKESEKNHFSTSILKAKKIPFVRQGKAREGKDLLDIDKKFIEDETRSIAQMLGYRY